MNKETYDSLPLTRWLEKTGKPIEDHPDLPTEHKAKRNSQKKFRDADENNAQVQDSEGNAEGKKLRPRGSGNRKGDGRRGFKETTRETSRRQTCGLGKW